MCCDKEELAFPAPTAFLCLPSQIPWGGLFIYPLKLGVGVFPVPSPTSSHCMKAAAPSGSLGWTWHLSCKPVCAAVCIPALFRTEIIQRKHIKRTFVCFQLKSAVYYASRMVRSELVSFQLREGLWTHKLFIELFGKQLFPISAILIMGTAQVFVKNKAIPYMIHWGSPL